MKQYTEQEIQDLATINGMYGGYAMKDYRPFRTGFKAALSLIEKDEQQSLGCGDGFGDLRSLFIKWKEDEFDSFDDDYAQQHRYGAERAFKWITSNASVIPNSK